MSEDSARAFLQRLHDDALFRRDLEQAADRKDFLAQAGFVFSQAEYDQAWQTFQPRADAGAGASGEEGELEEAELDAVAGGVGGMPFLTAMRVHIPGLT